MYDHSRHFNENKCQCQAFYTSTFTRWMITVAENDLVQLSLLVNVWMLKYSPQSSMVSLTDRPNPCKYTFNKNTEVPHECCPTFIIIYQSAGQFMHSLMLFIISSSTSSIRHLVSFHMDQITRELWLLWWQTCYWRAGSVSKAAPMAWLICPTFPPPPLLCHCRPNG